MRLFQLYSLPTAWTREEIGSIPTQLVFKEGNSKIRTHYKQDGDRVCSEKGNFGGLVGCDRVVGVMTTLEAFTRTCMGARRVHVSKA